LVFSADDARTYLIEDSTNLLDWETLGTPSEDEQQNGDYTFEDDQPNESPAHYYRVVTQ
jgi:hypothetical protein